jgi:hypothetical protein
MPISTRGPLTGDEVLEELRAAAFDVLKRLALQIRELEHPQQDDSAASQDPEKPT